MQLREDLKGLNGTQGAGPTDVTFLFRKEQNGKEKNKTKLKNTTLVNWVSGEKRVDFKDHQFSWSN